MNKALLFCWLPRFRRMRRWISPVNWKRRRRSSPSQPVRVAITLVDR